MIRLTRSPLGTSLSRITRATASRYRRTLFNAEYAQSNRFSSGAAGSKTRSRGIMFTASFFAATLLGLTTSFADDQKFAAEPVSSAICSPERYSLIVVGGGTAGCTVAYLTAKWMEEHGIKGKVLLVDKGVDFFDTQAGPDPRMAAWFENWGIYGQAHPALREDGSAYPVTGTDHRGIGGCGTHDTRITFQPTPTTLRRLAEMMGWSERRARSYYQAALNLMPIVPAIPADQPEAFYQALLEALPADMRAPGDCFDTNITKNALAISALASYPNELRWTSAYLLHESVRPSNLEVLTNATVEKVVLVESPQESAGGADSAVAARGVLVRVAEAGDEANHGQGQGRERQIFLCLDDHGEVALTGGAFGAPAVLQRSGVGPRQVLEAAGVDAVRVDNPEVGHGADHTEIAVLYEWLDRWNQPSTDGPPRGGMMGWPMVAFLPFPDNHSDLFPTDEPPLSEFVMGHFGAGYAEPYTDFPTVVCTPNCIRPDLRTGFRAQITSADPHASLKVVHAEQDADWAAMAKGVLSAVDLMEKLRAKGIVGRRLEPDFELEPRRLVEWVRENHYTAFHWACTCQAGARGRVADQRFRVRDGAGLASRLVWKSEDSRSRSDSGSDSDDCDDSEGRYPGVVQNLLVGSAAALPELPDANTHLTVTAFSVALAEELVRTQAARRGVRFQPPTEVRRATMDVCLAAAEAKKREPQRGTDSVSPLLVVRRPGEEYPDVAQIAADHFQAWQKIRPDSN